MIYVAIDIISLESGIEVTSMESPIEDISLGWDNEVISKGSDKIDINTYVERSSQIARSSHIKYSDPPKGFSLRKLKIIKTYTIYTN